MMDLISQILKLTILRHCSMDYFKNEILKHETYNIICIIIFPININLKYCKQKEVNRNKVVMFCLDVSVCKMT